jgi:hypothetical protein
LIQLNRSNNRRSASQTISINAMSTLSFVKTYASTALGWIVVAACIFAYAKYYRAPKQRARPRTQKTGAILSDSDSRSKSRRDLYANVSDSASGANEKKPKKKTPVSVAQPVSTDYKYNDDKAEAEDLAWAQELERARKGTVVTGSKRPESRQKTVKQTNANKVAADLSGETSTTGGGDADDDFSPSASPELVPVAGDFNDMLETRTPGAAILRVVPAQWPQPAKAKKEFKPPVQEESKKQRQNRRKNEERKAQLEEIEGVRKTQLENQRRTAREARGEPAKNGMAPKPATNAWAVKPVQPSTNGSLLLDTSEIANLTEKDQIRLITENDESSWQTVSKRTKSKRKNTLDTDDGAAEELDGVANGFH